MKIVANLLDKVRPLFSKGKLKRMHCMFDAADNALFLTPLKTENAPFGRDPIEIKRYMFTVIFALMPAFLASLYFFGWRVLLMIMVSFIAGGIVEVLFAVVRKEEICEGFLVTGFIFPLILPPSIPLVDGCRRYRIRSTRWEGNIWRNRKEPFQCSIIGTVFSRAGISCCHDCRMDGACHGDLWKAVLKYLNRDC